MSKIQEALNKLRAGGESEHRQGDADTNSGLMQQSSAFNTSVKSGQVDLAKLLIEPMERDGSELDARRVVHLNMRDEKVFNSFRDLRTTVLRRLYDSKDSVIIVTGISKGAGSTFVSFNLGAAIALDENRTALIVDCDLRNPSLHNVLPDLSTKRGLRDYINEVDVPVEEIILKTGIPRLRLMVAGGDSQSTTEYLTSARLHGLIAQLRDRYPERIIILNAPPITESADARILTEVSKHTLLVVPHGAATIEQIVAAAKSIGQEHLLGVVFNNLPQYVNWH